MTTRHLAPLCAALLALSAPAAAKDPWQDPTQNSENRLPAHAWLPPDGRVKSLNGVWRYWWCGRPDQRPRAFWKTDFDDAAWFTIDVPCCVETRGWGVPHYANVKYPHPKTPPTITDDYNPVSSYRTTFTVPADWAGQTVILRFDGVYSAYTVWVNGRKIGYAEDSKLPSEFDITGALVPGDNLLAVEVFRWCDGSYVEDQDMFRYSGIFRDVTLYAVPAKGAIRDFRLDTTLDAAYRDATLSLSVDADAPVTAVLLDADGREAGVFKDGALALPGAHLWSAESPYLYTLVLTTDTDRRTVPVGVRVCEIKNNIILVNGRPVKFKGVNRHEMSVADGRTPTFAEMEKDVQMMKRANFNCLRMSHYPNHPKMYELCDRYGLYVCAEANVESHGMGTWKNPGGKGREERLGFQPEWTHTVVERNVRNVLNYRNRACVVIWSLGNESGPAGTVFTEAYAAIKALDPVRPVHYEGDHWKVSDVISGMYPKLEWIAEQAKKPKAFFLCEYECAMGNGMGNLKEYWEAFYADDKLSGGCIWDWIDQAVWKETDRVGPDGRRIRLLAYGGDHDEQPNDGPFCSNGLVDAYRNPSAKLNEARFVQRPVVVTCADAAAGKAEFWNRYEFTYADDVCDGVWTLTEDGVQVAAGALDVPHVAPRAKGAIALPRPAFTPDPAKEYFYRVAFRLKTAAPWADKGYEVAWDQLPYGAAAQPAADTAAPSAAPVFADTADAVTVTTPRAKAVFSKASGTLCELVLDGKTILADRAGIVAGPQLQVERAFTDADNWMRTPFLEKGLTQLRHHARPLRIADGKVFSSVRVTGAKSGGFEHETVWSFGADGAVTAENTVTPFGDVPALPRLGTFQRLDASLENLAWYGRGPWENYIDRCEGCDIGLYRSTVTDQYVDYIRPQDCGGKTAVRWAMLTDANGRGVKVTCDAPFFLQALHYTHDDLDQARHRPGEPRRNAPLVPRAEVCLSIDCRQTGLGCDNCGPIPLPQYRFPVEKTTWRLTFAPVTPD